MSGEGLRVGAPGFRFGNEVDSVRQLGKAVIGSTEALKAGGVDASGVGTVLEWIRSGRVVHRGSKQV